jgi:hypothetical protein
MELAQMGGGALIIREVQPKTSGRWERQMPRIEPDVLIDAEGMSSWASRMRNARAAIESEARSVFVSGTRMAMPVCRAALRCPGDPEASRPPLSCTPQAQTLITNRLLHLGSASRDANDTNLNSASPVLARTSPVFGTSITVHFLVSALPNSCPSLGFFLLLACLLACLLAGRPVSASAAGPASRAGTPSPLPDTLETA